jgi:sulfur-oxidizing protein SoxY
VLQSIVGDKKPLDERVIVDIPELAENGNIVPYKLDVESPMTAEDHITKLYLLSTQNPQAKVAVFSFTLASGKAAVTGRMRLAKTQDVVAIAETNKGEFLRGTRNVEVTIGGCGTE